MIGATLDYFYGERVRQNLAKRLNEECGQQIGDLVWRSCIRTMAINLELGIIPRDFFRSLRKSGLSLDDASVAMLDTSVTTLWDQHRRPNGPDLTQTLHLMEQALDKVFLARPGQIVPRNGDVGRSLDDFASEAV